MPGSSNTLTDLAQGLRIVNAGSDQILSGQRVTLSILPQVSELRTAPADAPVRLSVQWSPVMVVEPDSTEKPVADVEAPAGLTSPTVHLVFPHRLGGNTTVPKVKLRVSAKVQLSSGSQQSDWVSLPALPLELVTLRHLVDALEGLSSRLEIVRSGFGVAAPSQPVTLRLQQLAGSKPLPQDVPIRMETRWTVTNATGGNLQRDQDFEAPQGLSSPEVSLSFPPQVHGGTTTPAPLAVKVQASIRLSAGEQATPWKEVGVLPLGIARLPDPGTVLDTLAQALEVVRDGLGVVRADQPVRFSLENAAGWEPPSNVPVRMEVQWSVEAEAGTPFPELEASGLRSRQLHLRFLPQEVRPGMVENTANLTVRANVRLLTGSTTRSLSLTGPLALRRLAEAAPG